MPIIQTPAADGPLTQGDVLSGIALFATKASWEDKGGQAALARFDLCLVLSRPCVAAHKKHVAVAGVAKYPDAVPKGIDSFDKVLDFLSGTRDGLAPPDIFYLGQLPGYTGRLRPAGFAAHDRGPRGSRTAVPDSSPRAGSLPSSRTSSVTCTCVSSAPLPAWASMTQGGPPRRIYSGW